MITPLITLISPGPYQLFTATSGKTYLSDGNALIANVPSADAVDLIHLGCISPFSGTFDVAFASAEGDILYRGATGWMALPPGMPGQFLQTQGASANPQWAPGGGIPGGSSNQIQFNSSGTFAGVPNSDASDASGYIFPRVITVSMPGPRVVANDVANWTILPWAGKFVKAWLIAKTGPTGASFILDVQKSSNNGSSFSTLWGTNPSNKPTIAANSVAGNTSSFDTTTLAAGDVLRFDIDQVGSSIAGSDVTLALAIATQNT